MTESAGLRKMAQYSCCRYPSSYSEEKRLLPSRVLAEFFCWLIAIVLLALPFSAMAEELTPAITDTPLGKFLEEWSEDRHIPLDEIHSTDVPWSAVTSDVPNPGISSPPHWYRLSLTIPAERPDYIVDINYPRIEHLDYLLFCNNMLVDQHAAANPIGKVPEQQPELSFQFRLPFNANGMCTLYFRVENSALLNFPLRLLEDSQARDVNEERNLFYGLYSGFLVILLLYNLALFIALRERYLLYFCGFVVFYLAFFWAHTGIGYRYFWSGWPLFEARSTFFTSVTAIFFIVLFTGRFISVRKRYRTLISHLQWLTIAATGLTIIATQTLSIPWVVNMMKGITLLVPVFLILIVTLAGVFRSPSNLAYAIGIYSLAVSIFLHSLARQGMIPTNLFIAYISHFGAISVIAIHSLAIVLRLYEQRLQQIRTRQDIIAARKRAKADQERLRQSQRTLAQTEADARTKSAFLAMMSHEIRTPLNGVLGMVELLQHTRLDSQQKRYVETIAGSGENLLSLLNDVLDLSKIESGKMTIEKREVALIPLINDTIMLYSRQAREKNITLLADIGHPQYTHIYTDENRLRQILNNLLNNAIKFTEKGHVILRLNWHNGSLQIHVEDTGIGISDDERELLFNSFSQIRNASKDYGGTGLGLTICQRLSELLGGRIDLRSVPGEGSVFTVTLHDVNPTGHKPIADLTRHSCFIDITNESEKALVQEVVARLGIRSIESRYQEPLDFVITDAPPSSTEATDNAIYIVDRYLPRLSKDKQCERPLRSHVLLQLVMKLIELSDALDEDISNYRRGTIWIAEDNIVNQKVIVGMMRHLDMECEVFADGAEITEAFYNRPADPDLILMDCEMPVKDGYEATREIRAHEREHSLPHLPVIALTAHLGEEFSNMARDSGMDDLINKPVRKQTLRKIFATWLPQHESM